MIRRTRFTNTCLGKLPHAEQQTLTYPDAEVTGLKLKVGKKRKTFVLEKRIRGHQGSAITFKLGTFPNMSVEEARRKARDYANLCEQGADPRTHHGTSITRPVTLREASEKFFEISRLAPRTIERYQCYLNLHLGDWLDRDLGTLTVDDIVERYHQIAARYPRVAKESIKLLGNIWDRVAPLIRSGKQRLLPINPVPEARKGLGGWQKMKPKRTVIPLHRLGEWLCTVETLRRDAKTTPLSKMTCEVLLLSLYCGFRNTECRSLQWSDIDLDLGSIRIQGEQAKNGQEHFVPLSSQAWELLKEIHRARGESPYIWTSSKPGPYAIIGRMAPVLDQISQTMGFHFRPHVTRRTFSSIAHYLGIPWLSLKRMLNHLYQGGVTGGYVVPEFDPTQNRQYFQQVGDFITEQKQAYLEQTAKSQTAEEVTA